MIRREKEREELGFAPVKYHGKWPFIRVSIFQVCRIMPILTRTLSNHNYFIHMIGTYFNSNILVQEPVSSLFSVLNLIMHFHGWLSFFLLVCYKLPLKPLSKRTYYEYTGLWHIYGFVAMNAWFWSFIFHSR